MYLYIINYKVDDEDICRMEMRHLFSAEPDNKYLISNRFIDVDRSPFIKALIDIKLTAASLEELVEKVINENISYDNFKVKYIDIEDNVEFNDRHKIEGIVGYDVIGEAKLHDPDVILGVTRLKDEWILGEYTRTSGIWKIHNDRPYYYCNSLTTRLARALVNIAIDNNKNTKLIDPCCGIGTVLIEALSMGIDIEGYDINPLVVENARENIKYFGYRDVILEKSIHELQGNYDCAIIDLPYGVLSISSRKEQIDIIKSASKITNRMVIVSIEDFDRQIEEAGFSIIDRCEAAKGKFKRFVTLCEKNNRI